MQLLTHEVAAILEVSPVRIRQLADSHALPSVRIGGIRVFIRADVLALKAQRERERLEKRAR